MTVRSVELKWYGCVKLAFVICDVWNVAIKVFRGDRMNALEQFEEVLQFGGRTEDTLNRFLMVAGDFIKFCKKQTDFTKHDVIRYLAQKRKEGCKGSYLGYLYDVLQGFFQALETPWPWPTKEERKKHRPKSEGEPYQPYFTLPEQMKMLKAAAKMSPRDELIIRLATITFCRRKEIHLMDKKDYNRKGGRIWIKTVKRGAAGWRKLDPVTKRKLDSYLDDVAHPRMKPLLESSKKKLKHRISVGELSRIQKRCRKIAGITKRRAGFHASRRGGVTLLHDQGISESEITQYMRWKSPFMVNRYIKLVPGKVEKKVIKAHPLFNKEA